MLKKEANKRKSIDDYVELGFSIFRSFPLKQLSIRPAQVKEEITNFLKILAMHKPKTILEIGTENGGTLFLFARVSRPDAVIISIDLPGGRFGGGYREWKIPFYKSFAIHEQKLYLIREDSHKLSTLNMVEKVLEGRKLDFLFIDGDHTLKGVKKDFEIYGKLVGNGGIIAFHDIVIGPPENVGDVPKFWNRLRHNFKYVELVKDWTQGGYGIGVIYV